MWRVYAMSAVVAGVVALATTLVTARLTTPAVPVGSPSGDVTARGDRPPPEPPLIQEGEAAVHTAKSLTEPAEVEVFYKLPFATPPHLTFPDGLDHGCQVAGQTASGFRLRRVEGSGVVYARVRWRAEGQAAR